MPMYDNFPSMHFFVNGIGSMMYIPGNLLQVLGFGARSNVEPFLGLAGIFKELCKFWILELATMLSPFLVLRIFEKIWLDLAAMFEFEPSSRILH
ncbi:hypothetical protein AAC387_Pa12g0440 [Persea americana]